MSLNDLIVQLAEAVENEGERRQLFQATQRTQAKAAKHLEDASAAVREIELQIRKFATGDRS